MQNIQAKTQSTTPRIDITKQIVAIHYFFSRQLIRTFMFIIIIRGARRGPDCMVVVFSTGIPVSSTNKTDHHDITEILLKVALTL